ncbi:MAG: glycoside hydrolase family 3 C-terminal domain-containing protein, partial [Lachnospiraceae bacterium]|nr:glycoside hydrolase family 3 C-terminal domain-containing protein [Lachnospiraceae bacterium]
DKYLGISEDGITVILVEEDKADSFKITLWDDSRMVFRSMTTNKLLTLNPPENKKLNDLTAEPKILYSAADEAFGWFVREEFYFADKDGNVISFNNDNALSFWKDESIANILAWNKTKLEIGDVVIDGIEIETVKDPVWEEIIKGEVLGEDNGIPKDTEVVAVFGAHPLVNCKEEIDRKTIELSPYFKCVIRKLSDYFEGINLVILSNYPMGLKEEQENKKIKSILWSATGSEEIGSGISDILFGDATPAGRVNMTWYKDDADLTDIRDYRINENKKTYFYFDKEVLYEFGYGLSYTKFEYSGVSIEVKEKTENSKCAWNSVGTLGNSKDQGVISVNLDIVNVGDYTSDEVIQVYVAEANREEGSPIKSLKGFKRVKDIKPQEKRNVQIDININDIRKYSEEANKSMPVKGEIEVMVGKSSKDIIARARVRI